MEMLEWVLWKAEMLFGQKEANSWPKWVSELLTLPKAEVSISKEQTVNVPHFLDPFSSEALPLKFVAAMLLAAFCMSTMCQEYGLPFVAPPILWEFIQDAFLPLKEEENPVNVDEYDRAWASIRALTYTHMVTCSNSFPEDPPPLPKETHDEYEA